MPRTPVVVTIADFRTRFPEFAATDDGHIEFAIEEALLIHSIRKLATLYCAAHVLSFRLTAISGGGGSGGGTTTVTGQLESRRVGPLQETFSTHSGTASGTGGSSARTRSPEDIAYFSSTIYGQHFLSLEPRTARAGIGAMVAG